MDKNDISQIRALCGVATDGKWIVDEDDYTGYCIFSDDGDDSYELGSIVDKQDAEFIAQSRTIIPALLDEIEQYKDAEENGLLVRSECNWLQYDEDNGTWECSNCDAVWMLNDGDPFDNKMKYCPVCGSKIKSTIFYEYDSDSGEHIERVITAEQAPKKEDDANA